MVVVAVAEAIAAAVATKAAGWKGGEERVETGAQMQQFEPSIGLLFSILILGLACIFYSIRHISLLWIDVKVY